MEHKLNMKNKKTDFNISKNNAGRSNPQKKNLIKSNTIWTTTAPSNIALIKYMGKKDYHNNIPLNPSLSYTLEHLKSLVQLETCDFKSDIWLPYKKKGFYPLKLNEQQQNRFLSHLKNIKKIFKYKKNFIVKSANNYPADSGIASSASSFAALTMCAIKALKELTNNKKNFNTMQEISLISSKGSGSSIRSFYSPWCLWNIKECKTIKIPYSNLIHQVVIVSSQKKNISSSNAHKLIGSSLLYKDRKKRSIKRLNLLLKSFKNNNWEEAFYICWNEFWDMHALFETSKTPFGYIEPKTLEIIQFIKNFWKQKNDGPIVTIDAGPNVHLLYKSTQKKIAIDIRNKLKKFKIKILSNLN